MNAHPPQTDAEPWLVTRWVPGADDSAVCRPLGSHQPGGPLRRVVGQSRLLTGIQHLGSGLGGREGLPRPVDQVDDSVVSVDLISIMVVVILEIILRVRGRCRDGAEDQLRARVEGRRLHRLGAGAVHGEDPGCVAAGRRGPKGAAGAD